MSSSRFCAATRCRRLRASASSSSVAAALRRFSSSRCCFAAVCAAWILAGGTDGANSAARACGLWPWRLETLLWFVCLLFDGPETCTRAARRAARTWPRNDPPPSPPPAPAASVSCACPRLRTERADFILCAPTGGLLLPGWRGLVAALCPRRGYCPAADFGPLRLADRAPRGIMAP